jgi:hypothetical protein
MVLLIKKIKIKYIYNMDIINILLYVWILLLIMIIYLYFKNEKRKQGFTPKIRSYYNPHIRNLRRITETFLNKYNENYFIKKLKNMGIY